MKITKRQLRRIIKEATGENIDLNAKIKIQDALDATLRGEIAYMFKDYGMGERLGRNAGHTLSMSGSELLMGLDPQRRVELFKEVAAELAESSSFWAAIEMMIGDIEFKRLIKKMSTQFEAELMSR